MAKYSFDRILPEDFESMAQALLEGVYRVDGNLIQFGDGADGGREATWTQPPTHATYARPANETTDVPKQWVFQVKYHDIGQRGWSIARNAVADDLENELEKVVNKYKVPCHTYVMITNVPFTGVRNVGTRDQIIEIAEKWRRKIPEILVWDAADLSRMLDASESVRTAYIETILPGDILKAIYSRSKFQDDRVKSAYRAYLQFVTEREGSARAEEAGDEPGLPLADVFIDLTLTPHENARYLLRQTSGGWSGRENQNPDLLSEFLPFAPDKIPASFALFFVEPEAILLLGGPGLGKSTLTQFLALYQAARIVNPSLAQRLAQRLKLPKGILPQHLDAHCRLRFPLRIELRRYAKWMSDERNAQKLGELARYIAEVLINQNVSSTLNMDEIFALVASDPILLILDGLDEVPHPETRKQILENLDIFYRRARAENGDIQMLFSSRPKGYFGEFNRFESITWELNELERKDFDDYCDQWLAHRIRDGEERREARERIDRGMNSEAVARLARSLLQATVMLTIVRRKSEIPHQRNTLYARYVDVIFDREKEKSAVVRERTTELLRLHERVGYELHRKMEQTRVESLDREAFRSYVLSVLEDYSGAELGEKKLREVADEIITAATDRLCLLVGKGRDQMEIDFIVQSFREYFAASYLFNHPEADPDRVFPLLVRRGGYWANVFQFYAAQANANQQMRWILSADGSGAKEDFAESAIELIKLRRAILNVLPEFSLQRRNDFDRALKIVFNPDTRWSWLGQQAAVEILQIIRSGVARHTLWELLSNFSVSDSASLQVELWLSASLIPRGSQEDVLLCHKVQDLLMEERTWSTAWQTITQHNLNIDLSLQPISKIKKIAAADRSLPHSWLARQSKAMQCELLLADFTSAPVSPRDGEGESFLSRMERVLRPSGSLSIFGGKVQLSLYPYLLRRFEHPKEIDLLHKELDEVGGRYAVYIDALLHAVSEPANAELDQQAREMETEMALDIGQEGKTDYLLGPSVSEFSSLKAWEEFKEALANLSTTPNLITHDVNLDAKSNLWMALLFHPEDWKALVDEGLLSREEYQELYTSPLGYLLKTPLYPLQVTTTGWTVIGPDEDSEPIALSSFLRAALRVAEAKGTSSIARGDGFDGVLWGRPIVPSDPDEVEQLLCKAANLSDLSSFWVGAFLRLGLFVPINANIILNFWERHENSSPRIGWIGSFPGNELPQTCDQLLKSLLATQRESAIRLASAIMIGGKPSIEVQNQFRDPLTIMFSQSAKGTYSCQVTFEALMNFDFSAEEFLIWKQPENITRIGESSWHRHRLCDRFNSVASDGRLQNLQSLRQQFLHFISHYQKYPLEIAIAALEAIIKIDASNLPPLKDSDWRQSAE